MRNYLINLVMVLLLLFITGQVKSDDIQDNILLLQKFFPTADHVDDLKGEPLSAAVYEGRHILGYVYYTDDVVKMPAYSGKPIRTLVGFDVSGEIVGLKIVHHEEPILVTGISNTDLQTFIHQYLNRYVNEKIKIGGQERDGFKSIDAVSGATITMMVLNASINQSMRKVAKSHGILSQDGKSLESADKFDTEPVWVYVWRSKIFQISILMISLTILILILIMQDWLARHPTFLT